MPRRQKNLQNSQFWESEKINNATYIMYYNRLCELAISCFKWHNLPPTVDERFLELSLLTDGKAVFFYDDAIGYLALRLMLGGEMDLYDIPTERTAYGSNGYNEKLTSDNSVIIFNNMLHTNQQLEIELYARRLWDLDRTIDINARAQKTPILITCEQEQRLTMANIYMKYDGNIPVIYGDKNLNPNAIKVLTTNSPYVADKLYQLKNQIWNEALTSLGISNLNIQKKERLITDESEKSQGATIANRYTRLNARQQACKQINNMFGLNLSVEFRDTSNDSIEVGQSDE